MKYRHCASLEALEAFRGHLKTAVNGEEVQKNTAEKTASHAPTRYANGGRGSREDSRWDTPQRGRPTHRLDLSAPATSQTEAAVQCDPSGKEPRHWTGKEAAGRVSGRARA